MRKIKIAELVSLDGIIQPGVPGETSEHAPGEWKVPYRTPEGAKAIAEAYGPQFDLLLGRRTYDLFAGNWPKVKVGAFAAAMNAATKYVATHRPKGLSWGPAMDLGKDVLQGIRNIKARTGPDLIVCGSSTLTVPLIEQGLVDELILGVHPVMLGTGIRWFPENAGTNGFKLIRSIATSTGVVLCVYEKDNATRKSRSTRAK